MANTRRMQGASAGNSGVDISSLHPMVSGTLWAMCVANSDGYGGQGSTTNTSIFTQVGSGTNWAMIAGVDRFWTAIKDDGSMWSCGWGSSGKLGTGSNSSVSVPTRVGTGTDWAKVAVGTNHGAALQKNGSLWTWGSNTSGSLGLGHTSYKWSPVQVGEDGQWIDAFCGHDCTFGIDADNKLFSWGDNAQGELGIGDLYHRSSPVQVGSLENWKMVSSGRQQFSYGTSIAIKTDGTMWTFGQANHYSTGGNASSSSPIQLGSDTNWSSCRAGSTENKMTVLALKTNGYLYSWGENEYGTTGSGDVTNPVSNPLTQVGSGGGWTEPFGVGSFYASGAIQSGALKRWGYNLSSGSLGIGVTTGGGYSNPTAVSLGGTDWVRFQGMYRGGLAIRT